MIARTHELPVKRRAELVTISRGTVYYHPEPISDAELRLLRVGRLSSICSSRFAAAEASLPRQSSKSSGKVRGRTTQVRADASVTCALKSRAPVSRATSRCGRGNAVQFSS